MLLSIQGTQIRSEGLVPASEIKSVRSSHPPFNSTVNRLDYAAFTDAEPEYEAATISGYGTPSGANATITIEFLTPLPIREVAVQTLKAATSGAWGIHYMRDCKVQALVDEVWQTVFTFPPGIPDASIGPDGKTYNEKWATIIPVGLVCSAIRLQNPNGYVCASTFAPYI